MLRCFPEFKPHRAHANHPILHWIKQYSDHREELNSQQQIALAQLIPLLLCGEQSALFVFHNECKRISDWNSLEPLQIIEADESLHEEVLQNLLNILPKVNNHNTKRRAQYFYAKLEQRTQSIPQHFLVISKLDACVCVIMNAIARSDLKGTYIGRLFELIKKDEARHVKLAKSHALYLDPNVEVDKNFCIEQELVQLLKSERESLIKLGIDDSFLFKRILELAKE